MELISRRKWRRRMQRLESLIGKKSVFSLGGLEAGQWNRAKSFVKGRWGVLRRVQKLEMAL